MFEVVALSNTHSSTLSIPTHSPFLCFSFSSTDPGWRRRRDHHQRRRHHHEDDAGHAPGGQDGEQSGSRRVVLVSCGFLWLCRVELRVELNCVREVFSVLPMLHEVVPNFLRSCRTLSLALTFHYLGQPIHTPFTPYTQLVELSQAQDVEAGDGTTSVVVIAGSLLAACERLLAKGECKMRRICRRICLRLLS